MVFSPAAGETSLALSTGIPRLPPCPSPGPHHHSPCDPLQLGGLQAHALGDAQRGPALGRRQGPVSQHVVPGHKVQLHGRRVVLESQQTLPDNGVFLGKRGRRGLQAEQGERGLKSWLSCEAVSDISIGGLKAQQRCNARSTLYRSGLGYILLNQEFSPFPSSWPVCLGGSRHPNSSATHPRLFPNALFPFTNGQIEK